MADRWMVCSACRKDIPWSSLYYACSVSTCNRPATRLVFCSVPCWDSHVATLRHRDAWAVEERAPATGAPAASPPAPAARTATTAAPSMPATAQVADKPPARIVVAPSPAAPSTGAPSTGAPSPGAAGSLDLQPADETEILIVVSKMKKYIRDRSGMNTSDAVAERLSDHVRALCDAAIRTAAGDGRKTVLDRDVPYVRR